jgi:hypothetical protein
MTIAQECGPACPVCSGAGTNAGALLSKGGVTLSALSIPTADEERTVLNARYGIFDWLDAGVGYAARTEKILWNVRVQPVIETEGSWRPGIILGTGSVQIGGSDQSAYVQFIKSMKVSETVGLQLSAGVATLLPDLDESFGQAGVTASFRDRYALFANYDGESFHEGISWIPSGSLSLSFMMVESEYPAISIMFKR